MKYLFLIIASVVPLYVQAWTERNKVNLTDVYNEIVRRDLTMVTRERYDSIDLIAKEIHEKNIEGDIVECGVWRGGMSIYLAYAFPKKKCWVCDSFQGFETAKNRKYDRFRIIDKGFLGGELAVPESVVRENFSAMGLDETMGITFLPGWVNDTTDPIRCPIEQLTLLRIDVDTYSATLVILENLYDKVVPGGFIIFDDSCLNETVAGIREFERKRKLDIVTHLRGPLGDFVGKIDGRCGLFYRKPE